MSVEAIAQALKLDIRPSSRKFVLVAFANCVNSDWLAYPSMAYLCEATSLDKKTVKQALAWLREQGYIADSGYRVGRTRQVIVYEVCLEPSGKGSDIGPVCEGEKGSDIGPVSDGGKGADSGPLKGDQNRTPLEGERGPIFPGKGSDFSSKGVRNRTTEPSGTVRKEKKGAREAGRGVTFDEWLASLNDAEPIPADDAVFRYAESVQLTEAVVYLAWRKFVSKHRGTDKRYRSWRQAFGNCVRDNWYKLWYFDKATGECALTTAGVQMQREVGDG